MYWRRISIDSNANRNVKKERTNMKTKIVHCRWIILNVIYVLRGAYVLRTKKDITVSFVYWTQNIQFISCGSGFCFDRCLSLRRHLCKTIHLFELAFVATFLTHFFFLRNWKRITTHKIDTLARCISSKNEKKFYFELAFEASTAKPCK